jgi:Family of unknown function (DUF5361)
VAGYTWDDVGRRLPWDQFIPFVFDAPPGTAIHFARGQGWTVSDYLLADVFDAIAMLLWAQSADAHQKPPRHKPKPLPRPDLDGSQAKKERAAKKQVMTVEDYVAKTGMVINLEGR